MENKTFLEFTKEQIKLDCEIIDKYKTKWYEYIPLLGWFIMVIRFGIELSRATRGEVTSQVNISVFPIILPSVAFYVLTIMSISFYLEGTWSIALSISLFTISIVCLSVTPIFLKIAIKKAIKKVRKIHFI